MKAEQSVLLLTATNKKPHVVQRGKQEGGAPTRPSPTIPRPSLRASCPLLLVVDTTRHDTTRHGQRWPEENSWKDLHLSREVRAKGDYDVWCVLTFRRFHSTVLRRRGRTAD